MYLPLFLPIPTSQYYHLTDNHMVCYNGISKEEGSNYLPGDLSTTEGEIDMKLKEVNLQVATSPQYELTWLKARKDLVESGETFCIDGLAKGRKPDDHGNYFWYLRLKKDGMDYDTERWMTKIQTGNEKRDKRFTDLQEAMKKEKAEGKDGIIHGCKLVELEGNFIILEAVQHGTCPCGAENLDDTPGFDDDLGDLGDHPF